MLNNVKTRKKEEGFTIIEVLIVLAIAGLILLTVFLAVPALQRNQRNSARRSEASRIAASANDVLTNSQGNPPALASDGTNILNSAGISSTSNLALTGGAGATTAPASTCSSLTTPTPSKLSVCSGAASFTAPTTATDWAVLGTGVQCSGASSFVAGTTRQMALIYTLESGSGRTLACIST